MPQPHVSPAPPYCGALPPVLSVLVATLAGWPRVLHALLPELVGKPSRVSSSLGQELNAFAVNLVTAGDLAGLRTVWSKPWDAALDPNSALSAAAGWGRHDVMQMMIERGASEFGKPMVLAARRGDMVAIGLMVPPSRALGDEKNGKAFAKGLVQAAGHGHIAVVESLIGDCTAQYIDVALAKAAGSGQIAAVEWLLDHKAGDHDRALALAARGGHTAVMEMVDPTETRCTGS